jgi:hypothetical protein
MIYLPLQTLCPRTIAEVEGVLNGAIWPPEVDQAPELKRKWGYIDSQDGRSIIDVVKMPSN